MTERRKESFFQIAIGGSSREDKLNQEEFFRRMLLAGFTIDDAGVIAITTAPSMALNADNLTSGTVPLARLSDIGNAQIANAAAIAQSKLALSITNAEVNASAAIAQSKLSLSITDAEVNASAAIAWSKLATIPNTALKVFDTDASHTLALVPGSNLTANRTLTLTTGDADRTITLSGNPTLADWFDQAVKAASSPTFVGLTLSGAIATPTTITQSGDHIFSANAVIRRSTSDGSDSGSLEITGGGASGYARGGTIVLYGNENTDVGSVKVRLGTVALSAFYVQTAAADVFKILESDGRSLFTSSVSYATDFPMTLRSTHASAPSGLNMAYTAAAPNGTTNEFIQAQDNAALRFAVRSNGGIANFSANNVNLSDARLKEDFQQPDTDAVWDAHKAMRGVWTLYRLKDQTHDDPNMGYTVQGVRKAWKHVAPWLVETFDAKARSLGVYDHDLKNFTGMVVTELQWRVDDLMARMKAAGL